MIPIRIGTMAVTSAIVGSPFKIQIDTTISGTGTETASNQFKLPVLGNYTIYWGDGSIENANVNSSEQFKTHTYSSGGIKTITVSWLNSVIVGVAFNNTGDRNKLLNIIAWGGANYTDLEGAFRGCTNLNATFTDIPNLSNVDSLAYMFDNALNFNNNISLWDLSTVNDTKYMFRNATSFNQPIGTWNMSSVVDSSHMFDGATSFNQDISAWDTSSIIFMKGMFFGATAFNQNISGWNVGAATDVSEMFRAASTFNQNIGSWDVSNAVFMQGMFRGATSFNQNIGSWITTSVTNMSSMFREAVAFNQNISGWDTGAVTDMGLMFNFASSFNQDISTWDTGAVTNMSAMFRDAAVFNQAIGIWDVSKVTDLSNMFNNADGFDQNIGAWQVTSATNFVDFMSNKAFTNFTATNLSAIYNGWTNYELQTQRSINFATIKYTSSATEARGLLTRSNTTTNITNVINNGSGLIRITALAHGLTTNNKVYIKSVGGTTEANGAWAVTVIDIDTIDLQSSAFVNTYTSGGILRTGYGWSVSDGGL